MRLAADVGRERNANSGPITRDRRRAQPHLPPVLAARYLLQPIGIAHIAHAGRNPDAAWRGRARARYRRSRSND